MVGARRLAQAPLSANGHGRAANHGSGAPASRPPLARPQPWRSHFKFEESTVSSSIRPLSLLVLTLVAAVALSACDRDNNNNANTTTGQNGACPAILMPNGAALKLSDAEIVATLRAANDGEIQFGQWAQSKTTDPSVQGFANLMVTMHTQANQQLDAVVSQQGLAQTTSPFAQQLQLETQQKMAIVAAMSSANALDRAYMDSQIAMHGDVLFLGESVLAPNAQNTAVQQQVSAAGEMTMQHLQQAIGIQQQLPR
jgi:putative membrane protein